MIARLPLALAALILPPVAALVLMGMAGLAVTVLWLCGLVLAFALAALPGLALTSLAHILAASLVFVRPLREELRRRSLATGLGGLVLTATVAAAGVFVFGQLLRETHEGAGAAQIAEGRELMEACMACHTMSGETLVGPPLRDIVGREIGRYPGYPYSDALSDLDGRWTVERLTAFLQDPQKNVPGTNMILGPIPEADARAIAAALAVESF